MTNYNSPADSVKTLKERRKRTFGRMQSLVDSANSRKLTPGEQDEWQIIERDLRQIDATLKVRADSKRHDKTKGYKGDNRTEGRSREVLGRDQSMTTWVNRAAENGLKVNTNEGTQVPITGGSFDLNEYWGQRMGFSKPGAEMRALGQDTAGSGQAITPQSWQANFIDYLYPNTLMGRAGASIMPMQTEIVNVPQFLAPPVPQWVAENGATSLDANPAFAPVVFNAKGAAYDITLFSIQMAQDAYISGGLSGMLATSAARAYQTFIDKTALYGITGNAGNPGLNNEAGMVFRKLAAHAGTTGQAPADPSDYSIAAEIVRNANAEPTGILESPQVLGTFNRLNANTVAKWWNMPNDVAALPIYYSTVIPVTETDPASGTLPAQVGGTFSSFYLGDWSRIVIGMHLDMTTQILTERYADQLQVGLLTAIRVSIRATHPETFIRDSGIITT